MLRDTEKSTPGEVTHFRGSPEGEDDDGRQLRIHVPAEDPRRAEENDEKQDHLRHDSDEFKVDARKNADRPVLLRHQNPQQDAQRQADSHRDQTDAERHPEASEKPCEVRTLKEHIKSEICHTISSLILVPLSGFFASSRLRMTYCPGPNDILPCHPELVERRIPSLA